ncbi:MAG: tetratricopeptide repeat protein [Verrucomicrobiota bacterium]
MSRKRTLSSPPVPRQAVEAPVAQAGTRAIPRRRLWVYRGVMGLGFPLVFFLLLEGSLRLAGFGYPTTFLLRARIKHREVLVQNDQFARRFFGPDLARQPFPLAIQSPKPRDTLRIFVFGESAAFGDPQPDFGLPRMLEAVLGGRYPGVRFEVVNAAMTAINSHAILVIARDCARAEGDVWLFYVGNNEVVGPFGAGTVFGPRAANLALIRSSLAVKATRTGQWVDALLDKLERPPVSMREWGGMAMFAQNQVRQDDPRMAGVYAHFGDNLGDILEVARKAGVTTVVSTVAANLKDCAPFASLHRPGLPVGDLAEWDRLYGQAVEAQRAGRWSEALDHLARAARIDSTYAELHYVWGKCCLALSEDAEAAAQFSLARDQDTLRFRADSRINEIIRQVATAHEAAGVRLVDVPEVLARTSPHRLVGNEYLHEHVHLRFEGNYLLARAFAEEVARLSPRLSRGADAGASWPSAAECARRLAWTDWARCQGESDVLRRLNDPPFTAQFDHAERLAQQQRDLEQLLPWNSAAGLQQALARCQEALAAAPGDWVVRRELALAQGKAGDFGGAAKSWAQIVDLLPHYTEGWLELGRALAEQNSGNQALEALHCALKLEPASVPALCAVGQILAAEGKGDEAKRAYERALKLKPYWSPAHVGLGRLLEAAGRSVEAEHHYREALKSRLYTPAALAALGRLCFDKGWLNEATTNFIDALRLDPSDLATHVNLGVTFQQLGRRAEAQAQFVEALRLDPTLAEAHVRLGLELGRQGDDLEAMEHFAAAVRAKPNFLEARLNLGVALLKQRRDTEALDQFRQALRQDPGNATALRYVQRLSTK